jgi:protein SCO1/2
MKTPFKLFSAVLMFGALSSLSVRHTLAQAKLGTMTSQVGFDQKLGARVPLDLHFRDEEGRDTYLGEYLGRKPVILVLLYYRCPLLCSQVLNGLTRSLKPLTLTAGSDFELVAVSISPAETPELASQKRTAYLERYGRSGAEEGWHFLVGAEEPIAELARTVGFRYQYNPQTKLYAHAAGIVILTPDGRVARYFYGIDYPPKDLQNEIKRAAAGQIGSPIGRLLLLCYDYDAATGKYTISIVRLIRVLGTMTALSLGMLVLMMLRRERRSRPGDSSPSELQSGHIASSTVLGPHS